MRYRNFEPADEPATLPTKVALLTQIEADHYAERQGENRTEVLKQLDDRHRAVQAAGDDEAARKAYDDALAALNAPIEPVEVSE
jgi:hypothetical protein